MAKSNIAKAFEKESQWTVGDLKALIAEMPSELPIGIGVHEDRDGHQRTFLYAQLTRGMAPEVTKENESMPNV